jgi:hypothetical protein
MRSAKCLILAILCLHLTGCAGVVLFGAGTAAGVAGYKYYKGALDVTYKASFEDTWKASMAALKEMNCEIERSKHDITTGSIWAKFDDGKPVNISIEYESATQTKAVIRVGALGEKEASLIVKDKIAKHLKKG